VTRRPCARQDHKALWTPCLCHLALHRLSLSRVGTGRKLKNNVDDMLVRAQAARTRTATCTRARSPLRYRVRASRPLPCVALTASSPLAIRVRRRQGLYILRAAGPDGDVRGDPKRAIVAESTFVPQPDTSFEYELNGGVHYVVVPCTYGPGRLGRFTLAASSATGFQFRALQ
jgi:hypothetical protein